jgi:hypothetical protein
VRTCSLRTFCFLTDERATCDSYVAEAFYSGVKGAQLISVTAFSGDVWVFDCTAEINVTIKIGGQSYPIHPLDLSQPLIDDNGQPIVNKGQQSCYGPVRVGYLQSTICVADV